MPTTIIVCDTCRWQPDVRRRTEDNKTGGEVLAEHLERAASEATCVEVRRHSCLNGCQRHCNAAVVAPGKTSYYLTQFAPKAESAETIVAFASLHHESPDGTVPKAIRPEALAGHLMGRIPSLDPAG